MIAHVRRICVIGPESTGKTTLAMQLAEHLHTSWIAEAARLHAERVHRELSAADVEPIARLHITLADDATQRASENSCSSVVFDTDLVSTVVYARHYYGACPAWIVEAAQQRLADIYLLCDVDLPWEADGIRDEPLNRAPLLAAFADTLANLGATYRLVTGTGEERLARAMQAFGPP